MYTFGSHGLTKICVDAASWAKLNPALIDCWKYVPPLQLTRGRLQQAGAKYNLPLLFFVSLNCVAITNARSELRTPMRIVCELLFLTPPAGDATSINVESSTRNTWARDPSRIYFSNGINLLGFSVYNVIYLLVTDQNSFKILIRYLIYLKIKK